MKNYLKRNLQKVVTIILSLLSAVDADMDSFETSLEGILEREFLKNFDLVTNSTTITESSNGDTIVQTSSAGTATTTFSQNSGVDYITTVIVPTDGDYDYTKTTSITPTVSGSTIATSYTRTAKQTQGGD